MSIKNLFALLAILFFNSLCAISLGKLGQPFQQDNVEWQLVNYQDGGVMMTAAMPGSPKTGITNDWCFICSQYLGSEYEIHFNPKLRFATPKTLDGFIAFFQSQPHTTITPLESTQPGVIYELELRTYTQDDTELEQISHVYATHDHIYFAIVVGQDFSLADRFFASFTIEAVK